MRRSQALLFTSREEGDWENDTVGLTVRAGLVRQFGSGLFGFTPAGERVRRKIVRRIDREMAAIGGQRVALPQLNYRPIWDRSGRWKHFEGEMFTLKNREGKRMCLAPSQEEGVVHLVDGVVRSYADLPVLLYQVGTKHRDDHARNGLLRTKEFTMKDAYSLHTTRQDLEEWYARVRAAYVRIFDSLGVDVAIVEADNSVMGGSTSEEFVAPVETGSVELVSCETDDCRFGATDETPGADYADGDACPDCGASLTAGEGIEVGHVFELGTRYSEPMDLTIDLADGSTRHVLMGSYGIGVERIIHTLLEQHADEDGCRWPVDDSDDGRLPGSHSGSVAPYDVSIVPLEYDGETRAMADRLYRVCGPADTLLFDDPDQTIGERFAESDLLGIPWKVVLGTHFEESGEVELERRDGETRYVEAEAVTEVVGR